jgi:hypothetical protein
MKIRKKKGSGGRAGRGEGRRSGGTSGGGGIRQGEEGGRA